MKPAALLLVLLLVCESLAAEVTVIRKGGKDWVLLDARVTLDAPASVEALARVIEDYPSYPRLFPKIREARAERVEGAVLLTEKVVVSALGIDNTNVFTLRIVRTEKAEGALLYAWTQHATDGSIDDLEGFWLLERRGSALAPSTRITYRTRSSVPVVVFGQDALIRLFLGAETRGVVDAVVKAAASR